MKGAANQSVERMAAGGCRLRSRALWAAAIAHFSRSVQDTMSEIPNSWLRQKGTPEDFERARLERMAAASDLPLVFYFVPYAETSKSWRLWPKLASQ
jgi:hypothetical protein